MYHVSIRLPGFLSRLLGRSSQRLAVVCSGVSTVRWQHCAAQRARGVTWTGAGEMCPLCLVCLYLNLYVFVYLYCLRVCLHSGLCCIGPAHRTHCWTFGTCAWRRGAVTPPTWFYLEPFVIYGLTHGSGVIGDWWYSGRLFLPLPLLPHIWWSLPPIINRGIPYFVLLPRWKDTCWHPDLAMRVCLF
jgi:hypothetical protein